MTSIATQLRQIFPVGTALDDEAFMRRHRFVVALVIAHVPLLALLATTADLPVAQVTGQALLPAALAAAALVTPRRRVRSMLTSTGLVWCSAVLVQLTGGQTEAHFHAFVVIAFVALYQDWVPLAWVVVATAARLFGVSALDPAWVFGDQAAREQPLMASLAFVGAAAVAVIAQMMVARASESELERSAALSADLTTAHEAEARRDAVSELFVSLARRNQNLLERQLGLIDELEADQTDPRALDDLFRLDLLATRMRRNAESLLVLSGEEPPRRWRDAAPLSEVVRAATAEVEEYARVDVVVGSDVRVEGRAVTDLVHLVAELIENATAFSAPTERVTARIGGAEGGGVVTIADAGIGMSEDAIEEANTRLADPPELDLRLSGMLGFHVVGRLARRLGIGVHLSARPAGGVLATVEVPPVLCCGADVTTGSDEEGSLAGDADVDGDVVGDAGEDGSAPRRRGLRRPSGRPGSTRPLRRSASTSRKPRRGSPADAPGERRGADGEIAPDADRVEDRHAVAVPSSRSWDAAAFDPPAAFQPTPAVDPPADLRPPPVPAPADGAALRNATAAPGPLHGQPSGRNGVPAPRTVTGTPSQPAERVAAPTDGAGDPEALGGHRPAPGADQLAGDQAADAELPVRMPGATRSAADLGGSLWDDAPGEPAPANAPAAVGARPDVGRDRSNLAGFQDGLARARTGSPALWRAIGDLGLEE